MYDRQPPPTLTHNTVHRSVQDRRFQVIEAVQRREDVPPKAVSSDCWKKLQLVVGTSWAVRLMQVQEQHAVCWIFETEWSWDAIQRKSSPRRQPMHTRTYMLCLLGWPCAYVHVWVCTYVTACACICMYINIYTCLHVRFTREPCPRAHLFSHIHATTDRQWVGQRVCLCVYMYVCMYVCIYVCVCVLVNVCVYYIYMYIYTYIYIHPLL